MNVRWKDFLKNLPKRDCPDCNGTGIVNDPVQVGAFARQERSYAGLSLREVARRMGFSAPYVCDLEMGRRKWNPQLLHDYIKAIQ